jgi:hypothetical protein
MVGDVKEACMGGHKLTISGHNIVGELPGMRHKKLGQFVDKAACSWQYYNGARGNRIPANTPPRDEESERGGDRWPH